MEDIEALTSHSNVDLQIWASLATMLERLPAALDEQLQRDSELTHFEFGVLYALARTPDGALRLSVLAEYSNSTLSRLSRAVTRLEARGWEIGRASCRERVEGWVGARSVNKNNTEAEGRRGRNRIR